MFDDMFVYPFEAEISAALKRLQVAAPVVGVLTGNEERSIAKYGDKSYKNMTTALTSRGALINQGFDVKDISINDQIPHNLAALVIADPKTDYTLEQISKIEDYISKGGNLLMLGEPERQSSLNRVIENLGVTFMPGTLLQQSEDFEADLLQVKFTPAAANYGFSFPEKAVVTMSGAVGLSYTDSGSFKKEPFLVTTKKNTWNKLGPINLKVETIKFDSTKEERIAVPVAIALTRKLADKDQKVIIFGDADVLSNAETDRFNIRNVNSILGTRMFKWFSDGAFPINVSRPDSIDTKILISRSGISWLKIIFLGVMPLLLALWGGITLMRRKRQ